VASAVDLTPTGNCYENAATLILSARSDELVLVHGRPVLQREPFCRYGHAWLEVCDLYCIDGVTGAAIPKPLYYALGKIRELECYRYTTAQTNRMLVEYGHYGPWEGPEGYAPVPIEER
jgi:hypothetical protein